MQRFGATLNPLHRMSARFAVASSSSAQMHTSPSVARGRTVYFNKHKKVTDPARQQVDYFETQAAKLPLDNNYIDALTLLYTEKIGSERELTLKAEDRLVGAESPTDFSLPNVDESRPRLEFRQVDALKHAPDDVKKVLSIGYGERHDLTTIWKRDLMDSVRKHSLESDTLAARAAWLTALVRHWSLLVNDYSKLTETKQTWLTHRIYMTLNYRRKVLRLLQASDLPTFEKVVRELGIQYVPPRQPEHVKTRKAWSEAQLKKRVEVEKEKRLEELRQEIDKDKEAKIVALDAEESALRAELSALERRLTEIDGLPDPTTTPVFQPPLVGQLAERTLHSILFYHPPPKKTTGGQSMGVGM